MILSESTSGGFFNLIPWVVLFPAAGMLINILFGSRLPEKVIGWIASAAAGLSFITACLLGVSLGSHPEAVVVPFANWIQVGSLAINWVFRVDTLSVTMMLVVSGVGTLIHIYSIGYMHEDVRFNEDPGRFRRFFVYMNLFIFMMMILVSANSYLMTFVGWEGVGLCSYLLIGFWFEKGKDGIGNAIAAKKAFITNRIGDFGFLIAMFLIFWGFKTLDFDTVFAQAGQVGAGLILAVTLFMLLGVAGKSAQIPLFVWLPDAMAGPTPVSALIHAATMVTAGVYLVARTAPLYTMSPTAQMVVSMVGAVTALFAATIAVGQYDIKKVLAYSTISQLGFMLAAVGMGAFFAGMFHLVTHAFFKALLFLSAGSVIQGMEHGHHIAAHGDEHAEEADPQDMRNMGGLRKRMGLTFGVYLIGALALAGIAPLAGFFSKDEILAYASQHTLVVYILLTLAALLTAFYMGRQILMVFYGEPRSEAAKHAMENPPLITVPLVVLAVLSVVGGALNLPGVETLAKWLEHTITSAKPGEFVIATAVISLAIALVSIFIAWLTYGRNPLKMGEPDPLKKILGPLFTALERRWWVDEFYTWLILNPYKAVSRFLAEPVDQGIIDGIANGLGSVTAAVSGTLRKIQNGLVSNYTLIMLIGVAAIFTYLFLR